MRTAARRRRCSPGLLSPPRPAAVAVVLEPGTAEHPYVSSRVQLDARGSVMRDGAVMPAVVGKVGPAGVLAVPAEARARAAPGRTRTAAPSALPALPDPHWAGSCEAGHGR